MDTLRRLYGPGAPATSNETLYTAPPEGAVIRHIRLANTTGADANISLGLNGTAATPANTICSGLVVPAHAINNDPSSIVLGPNDTITGLQGTSGAITATISGVEPEDATGASPTPLQIFAFKTADESRTNNTFADDTDLRFPVRAGEYWRFTALLLFKGANATMDAKFQFTLPASATARWDVESPSGSQTSGLSVPTVSGTPTAIRTDASTLSVGTNNVDQGVVIEGLVTVGGTAGNVVLQWAQNTTNGSNLTLYKGSVIIARKVA